MNYEESVRSLLALGRELAAPQQARVQKFGLENIRILSAELGNPHLAAPCVHIAGTNGKGSTAAMLESILRTAGFHTGLYTSPHLERINERIRVDGEEISDEAFAQAWTRVRATIESLMASGKLAAHPTFFECVTAIAFIGFQKAGREMRGERARGSTPWPIGAEASAQAQAPTPDQTFFAVYEVGLGGRLDSTNIVEPEVAVITPIDFDHESFLGHSIEEIASEKAGIIKPAGSVVSAPQRPEARDVIRRRAEEVGARLVESESVWRVREMTSRDGRYKAVISHVWEDQPRASTVANADGCSSASETLREKGSAATELSIASALPGRFQIDNALTATTAAIALRGRGYAISDDAIVSGIASARWPGRLEQIGERPTIYLDGGHNPAAARELKSFWQENFAGRRVILIYGAMRDKAVDEIAGLLFPLAERVILTQPRQTRAISASLLAEMTAGLARNVKVIADPTEALEDALAGSSPDDIVFVTGSLFLVGDLRRHWRLREAAGKS